MEAAGRNNTHQGRSSLPSTGQAGTENPVMCGHPDPLQYNHGKVPHPEQQTNQRTQKQKPAESCRLQPVVPYRVIRVQHGAYL